MIEQTRTEQQLPSNATITWTKLHTGQEGLFLRPRTLDGRTERKCMVHQGDQYPVNADSF